MQTQWMDIDYMFARWIMTLDPPRFALEKVQYVIDQLHANQQDFIVMVDPATFSGLPNSSVDNYETYQSGVQQDVFLKYDSGDLYQGVVWPGPTVFPDWTHPNAQGWWNSEFAKFFDPHSGVNVSGIWLDMNEPANFLPYVSALQALLTSSSKQTSTGFPRSESRPRSEASLEQSLGASLDLTSLLPAKTSQSHLVAVTKPMTLLLVLAMLPLDRTMSLQTT